MTSRNTISLLHQSPNWLISLLLSVVAWCYTVASVLAATPPGLASTTTGDPFAIPAAIGSTKTLPVDIVQTAVGTQTSTVPISELQNIYAVSITADVGLHNNDSGAIKIILTDDTQQKEYLVYETFSALSDTLSFKIQQACEETCVLPLISTFSLRIELTDATIHILELAYADTPLAAPAADLKATQNASKIQTLNAKNLGWMACETSVSQMNYEDKKRLFLKPVVPNLQGLEYYCGGVFEIKTNTPTLSPSSSTLTSSFDWRNRHGENWITPVRDQGQCGSCWAFAATGATEAVTNLYFNQHLNVDLAEQDVLSCSGAGSCDGGWPDSALDYIARSGIVNEACFSYSASDQPCQNKCGSPSEVVKISSKVEFSPKTEDTLKKLIIEQGPVSGGIRSMSHAMTLVGFTTDKDGQVVWSFKNSWGNWGDNGYANFKLPINDIDWTHAVINPVYDAKYQRNCVDKDNDQYCNWGISDKPSSCPASCKAERDCDDSNAQLGPFDANYNCSNTPPPPPPPPAQQFTVSNPGDGELEVTSITPETPATWLTVNPTAFKVSPGGSQVVSVKVGSQAPTVSLRLLINSNVSGKSPYPNGVYIGVTGSGSSEPVTSMATCDANKCSYPNIPFNKAGFYIAQVRLKEGSQEGFWGLEANTSSGANAGGFNAGTVLKENGLEAGFIGFYLGASEAVKLTVQEYSGQVSKMRVVVEQQDLQTGQRSPIYGPTFLASGDGDTTTVLIPGFYVASATSQDGNPRGRFGLELLGQNFTGGVNVGGWIDNFTGGNGEGFGAFYVASPQNVELNLLFGDNYSTKGAGPLTLTILYLNPVTGEREVYWSPPLSP